MKKLKVSTEVQNLQPFTSKPHIVYDVYPSAIIRHKLVMSITKPTNPENNIAIFIDQDQITNPDAYTCISYVKNYVRNIREHHLRESNTINATDMLCMFYAYTEPTNPSSDNQYKGIDINGHVENALSRALSRLSPTSQTRLLEELKCYHGQTFYDFTKGKKEPSLRDIVEYIFAGEDPGEDMIVVVENPAMNILILELSIAMVLENVLELLQDTELSSIGDTIVLMADINVVRIADYVCRTDDHDGDDEHDEYSNQRSIEIVELVREYFEGVDGIESYITDKGIEPDLTDIKELFRET